MNRKVFWNVLLFPPIALLLLLLPVATVALTYSMVFLPETSALRIASYVLSAYTLALWSVRIPSIYRFFRKFRHENKYVHRWLQDVHLRTQVTLTGNVLWNSAYGILQLSLGIYHKTPWFYALAAYYISLALMRLMLVRHTAQHKPGVNMKQELHRYRTCGWVFLATNLALSAMIFYMIYENRLVRHHEITTITLAAYTFTSLTMAIVNVVRYRKYRSPVFSASKAISLASALVSMVTLEGTMLATFGQSTPQTTQLFLSLSGGAISMFIVAMAIYMIVTGNRNLNSLEQNHEESRNI